MLAALACPENDGQLADWLMFFSKPKLLIIDELGYLPLLVARRYNNDSAGDQSACRLGISYSRRLTASKAFCNLRCSLETMRYLFPAPTSELPNSVFFEATGLLQIGRAITSGYLVMSLIQAKRKLQPYFQHR